MLDASLQCPALYVEVQTVQEVFPFAAYYK